MRSISQNCFLGVQGTLLVYATQTSNSNPELVLSILVYPNKGYDSQFKNFGSVLFAIETGAYHIGNTTVANEGHQSGTFCI
jgi:hypothetical protein